MFAKEIPILGIYELGWEWEIASESSKVKLVTNIWAKGSDLSKDKTVCLQKYARSGKE